MIPAYSRLRRHTSCQHRPPPRSGLGATSPTPAKNYPHAPNDPRYCDSVWPDTPPRRLPTRPFHWARPALGQLPTYMILNRPLRIAELCGCMATGMEALLRAGYAIASYTLTDIDPDAQAAVSHHLTRLLTTYPQLFPSDATQHWASSLPMDTRFISPNVFNAILLEGVDIILASPPRMTRHHPKFRHGEHPSGFQHSSAPCPSYTTPQWYAQQRGRVRLEHRKALAP